MNYLNKGGIAMRRAHRFRRRQTRRHSFRLLHMAALLVALIALLACFRTLRQREQRVVLAAFSLQPRAADAAQSERDAVRSFRELLCDAGSLADGRDLRAQSVLYARYYGRTPPGVAELESLLAQLAESESPSWLSRGMAARADRVQRILEQVLYGGDTNATQNEIAQMTQTEIVELRQPFISPIASFYGSWTAYVTSGYGPRSNPTSLSPETTFHAALDIAPPKGTDIVAVADGIVLFARRSRVDYGNHLAIDHGGGIATLYAHCDNLYIRAGDTVRQGQLIASVGESGNATGPHLHFEVLEGGRTVNPHRYLPHADDW